jgi:hypothetical protein
MYTVFRKATSFWRDRLLVVEPHAVLRGDGLVADLDRLADLLGQRRDDALADVDVVAGVLAVAQRVRQGAGRVAHTHRDHARGLDLADGVVRLREGRAGREGCDSECDELLLHTSLL